MGSAAFYRSMFDLSGNTVLVTGGARGIGLAIAEACAVCGAHALIADVNAGRAEAAAGQMRSDGLKGAALACDVTDSAAVAALFATNTIDVVVNNAGVSARIRAEDYQDADLKKMFDLNVNGVFYVMREAAKQWITAKRAGSIVNLASFAGVVADPLSAPYAASKGAVVQLTRTCAVEWAKHDIRVNAIGPGYVRTEMTAHTLDQPEVRAVINAKTAMGRPADTHEIAGAAVYLASKASSYVTGAILMVDGGWTAM
jgi:NAD(P)-dependent dehydrogenase (short-subunit alcohol dehydrogenase family)